MPKAFLGDLIPKEKRCGSKQGIIPRRRDIFQRGRNAKWIKSAFEVKVWRRSVDKLQVRREAKGEIIDLGGVQVSIGCW